MTATSVLLRAAAGLLAVSAAACAPGDAAGAPREAYAADTVPTAPPPATPPPTYEAFGLGLLRQVAAARPDSNVFLSPLSAGMALAMAYNGATGETKRQMAEALALGARGVDDVNAGNRWLRGALQGGGVELAVANGMWAARGVPFEPALTERVRAAYGAEVAEVDFTEDATPARINDWVARATRGRIAEITAAPMDPALLLYLTNAVYFKGRWADEFAPAATRDRPFLLPGGARAPRPTMHRLGSYGYLEGDGFRAVRLPYRGDRMALYVFLPDSASSLAAFRALLTPQRWDAWMAEFAPRDVDVALPRFRAEGTFPLVEPLAALGIRDAFDPTRATFHALLPASRLGGGRNVFISEAVQKTWIEVNEEGTEAAAATGIGASVTSAPPPPVPFVVDRPFVAAVRDDRTGALLFVGQVTDPR